jgi:chromatin structure-remodeling complex subunit RSC1/2
MQKNVKRRVYKTLDQFVRDMELMFNNAKTFNEDDSQLFIDAEELLKELKSAVKIEKAKTDEELAGAGEDGAPAHRNLRIPLESIEYKGETYRVGSYFPVSFLCREILISCR